ncbi:MAG TPA: glutamate formimidoyltransferase [Candidatus Eisenbacteria bacterium]|uniref:Formimidoyltransferase-cyclodeaminase n=1 Tax=Eiseniibacteriota bacterium TaxID=2212470 RepID=A0A7V2AVH3_UNCEI|nr:glutamate formimidoyltransferase [Candidatus Eisenbacteria bacterium]
MKLVECVPNFSEGRDAAVIDKITAEIRSTEGVKLLDVDPGRDTNRTVVTFIGSPEAAAEAAFKAIARAAEVIDMSKHIGAHPRMGATDVCPFVPVSDVTMAECAELARRLGARVGEELGIPVYLYEHAASSPERRNLANIRAGEYEGLPDKLKDPAWKPDFGPARFNAGAGATVIGAREFLIAYNVNLNTRDTRIAREIAFTIREKGRLKRDDRGQTVRDDAGRALYEPGVFKACKAVGWYMEDFGRAQVSINLVDYTITPPHLVFDECCRIAGGLGARVTGSELVGLIPLEAMLMAGRHYLEKLGKTRGVPESELIHTAVLSMGLGDLYPFEPEKKIIEYQFDRGGPLTAMRIDEFTDLLSTDAPAPGGGSVAALCGALSGALSSMVGALTHGKKGYEKSFGEMEAAGIEGQRLKAEFIADVDRDTAAFNRVMDAMRLPKKTDGEKAERAAAIEEATKEATRVPLEVLRRALAAAELARVAVEKGNRNSISDAGVAALAARTAAEGAYLNVRINLSGIEDASFKEKTLSEADRLRGEVVSHTEETVRLAEKSME